MKTEDFDDAIRRKLESVNTTHGQQDVNAVYNYVQSQKQRTSKRRAALILLASSAILIIGALLTWNVRQAKEISTLKQHISLLKIKAETTAPQEQITKAAPERSTNTLNASEIPAELKDNLGSGALAIAHENKKIQKEKDGSPGSEKARSSGNTTATRSSVTTSPLSEKPLQEHSNSVVQERAANVLVNKEETNHLVPEPESKHEKTDTLAPEIADTASPPPASLARALAPESADSSLDEAITEHPVFPNVWDHRIGLGLEKGNNQFGGGIFGEAVYKKRIAISAGIKLLKNGEERFDDDDDYDDHKKQEFKKTYGNQVDDDSRNIRIRNTLVQIPVTLSYIFPLKANVALLAGLGTDIDVYTKQHIEYRRANVANDMQTTQFVTKYPPAYFNNLVITAGIQKAVHHFVFQLSPYISPQLKKVDYKKDNCYYGLRLRVLFEF